MAHVKSLPESSPGHVSILSTLASQHFTTFEEIDEGNDIGGVTLSQSLDDAHTCPSLLLGEGYSSQLSLGGEAVSHHIQWKQLTAQ